MNLKRLAIALFVSAFAIRLILAIIFPLIPDEAYYWSWSTRPAICYWDQPAGSAIFLGIAERWFGRSELSLRLFPIFGSILSALLIFFILREFLSFELALLGVAIPLYIPLAFGQTLALHDSFMIPFWTMALYAANKLRYEPKRLLWWFLLSGFWALAVYSKLSALFFGVGFFLFLASTKRFREWLFNFRAWLAALLFVLLLAPFILWNMSHQGVTFLAVRRLTLINPVSGISSVALNLLDLLGSQALLVTPGLFLLILIALLKTPFDYRRNRSELALFLFSFSAPVFLYFLWVALKSKVQGNWLAPMYVSAIPLVLWHVKERWDKRLVRILVKISVIVCILEFLTFGAHLAFPIVKMPKDPTMQMWGYKELASRVEDEAKNCGASFVFARKYQVASELMFYLKQPLRVFCVNYSGRGNQFDLWNDFRNAEGENVIIVDTHKVSPALFLHFDSHVALEPFVAYRAKFLANTFYLYCAKGFRLSGPYQRYFEHPFKYSLQKLQHLVKMKENGHSD